MEGYKDESLSDEVQKWRHLAYTVIYYVVKINFEVDYMIIKKYAFILVFCLAISLLFLNIVLFAGVPVDDMVKLTVVNSEDVELEYLKDQCHIVKKTDGSLQGISIINNTQNWNSDLKYRIKIPDGGHIEYVESEEDKNDQSILIFDSNNDLVSFTENIVPSDLNDVYTVKTTITGNTITQNIEYNYGAKLSVDNNSNNLDNSNFGITLYATNKKQFNYWFFSGDWIIRNNVESLSLWHKGLTNSVGRRNAAWQTVVNKFSTSSKWYNTNGMKDQFMCHANIAGIFKVRWNLEPSRPDVGYLNTVRKGCNP